MSLRNRMLAVALIALTFVSEQITWGAWTITTPGTTQNKAMTASCGGAGEGASTQVFVRIINNQSQDEMNHAIGSYESVSMLWYANVAPPTGGFTEGAATVKLWKNGDQDTQNPLATREITITGM